MRSSVKHIPTLLPSRVEECRLSLKQILNGKRRVDLCQKCRQCCLKGKQPKFTPRVPEDHPSSSRGVAVIK